MGRNTPLLEEICKVLPLSDKADAITRLENHFRDKLIAVAGDINLVAPLAAGVRLWIDRHECSAVLAEITAGDGCSYTWTWWKKWSTICSWTASWNHDGKEGLVACQSFFIACGH